jgi:hypothetical protein
VADLHVWDNGCDICIAATAEEAAAFLEEHLGEPSEVSWSAVAPDHVLSFWTFDDDGSVASDGDDGASVTERTAAEWITHHGPGYVGSLDS